MAEIKSGMLSLVVDGKTIDLKTAAKLNFELNKDLSDPAKFAGFAKDPASFAKNYGLSIDDDISSQLSKKLTGFKSLSDVQNLTGDAGTVAATLWAVASGAYSVASSKIAVAF